MKSIKSGLRNVNDYVWPMTNPLHFTRCVSFSHFYREIITTTCFQHLFYSFFQDFSGAVDRGGMFYMFDSYYLPCQSQCETIDSIYVEGHVFWFFRLLFLNHNCTLETDWLQWGLNGHTWHTSAHIQSSTMSLKLKENWMLQNELQLLSSKQ